MATRSKTGGGSGAYNGTQRGGGGAGSYNSGSNQSNTEGAWATNGGRVVITFVA